MTERTTDEKPMAVKELAHELGFDPSYLYAVKRVAEGLFLGGRARLSEVEQWLRDHPEFKKRHAYASCNFRRKRDYNEH